MSSHAVKVLGISISTASEENILEKIQFYIRENEKLKHHKSQEFIKPFTIVTPNSEQIAFSRHDSFFADILNRADLAIPDGIGVVIAMNMLRSKQIVKENYTTLKRISGVDLMQDMIAIAARQGFTIGLIGGRRGVAVEALECLQKRYPSLRGWARETPEFEVRDGKLQIERSMLSIINEAAVHSYFLRLSRDILRKRTNMLFVALGAPKQEYFIERLMREWGEVVTDMQERVTPDVPLSELRPIVMMPVGGSFDMIAGRLTRAPQKVRDLGFEWLWRLIQQPWRWKRQVALARFFVAVLRERFNI